MAKSKNIKGVLLLLALVGLWLASKRQKPQHSSGAMFRTGGGTPEQEPESLTEIAPELTAGARPAEETAELEITELDFIDDFEESEEINDFDLI